MTWPLYHLTVIFDAAAQPLGASVSVEHYDGDRSTTPWPVGPFDTPDEVWQRLRESVDIQLTLW